MAEAPKKRSLLKQAAMQVGAGGSAGKICIFFFIY